MSPFALAILIITVARIFGFINGFHDAANSVATVAATRVRTPFQTVVYAAFFSFVRSARASRERSEKVLSNSAWLLPRWSSGLISAIAWDLIAWCLGLPTSSSHALIGGYPGGALANAAYKLGVPRGAGGTGAEQRPITVAFFVIAPVHAPIWVVLTDRNRCAPWALV